MLRNQVKGIWRNAWKKYWIGCERSKIVDLDTKGLGGFVWPQYCRVCLRGLEARKVLLIKATAFKSAQIRAVAEANQ